MNKKYINYIIKNLYKLYEFFNTINYYRNMR